MRHRLDMYSVLATDATPADQEALEASDYRVFHSTDALCRYVGNLRAEHAVG